MITYAGTGSWIYTEDRADLATTIAGSIFTTVNQTYFMGLFLLISAFFVPGSYERKGAARFIKDRLIRLGIPLLIYSWFIHPVVLYAALRTTGAVSQSFWELYPRAYFASGYFIGQGPLWFVETLLILALIYVAYRLLLKSHAAPVVEKPFPSTRAIVGFAALIGLATFIIRIGFPEGSNFKALNLQLPYFPGYIAMFAAGLAAYRNNWFASLPAAVGRRWLWICAILLLIGYPVALILGGALQDDTPFKGGLGWQALFWAFTSAFLGVGLSIGVVSLFKQHANRQGSWGRFLVPAAYAAYLIHAPVIVAVALLLRDLELYPLLKFALAGLISLPLSFGLGSLLRRLPYAGRVL
jgi:surface polysaccharide O-acyltransferase-like enzyme